MVVGVTRRQLLARAGELAASAPLLSLVACGGASHPHDLELRGRTMATTYRLRMRPPRAGLDGPRLHQGVAALLRRVNAQMSRWRPESELSRFNASRSRDWFRVSGETAQVVSAALDMHARSRGAFDPTIGPLAAVWGFGPGRTKHRVPDAAERRDGLTQIGAGGVAARHEPPALRKEDDALTLDLGAIAQGHALDEIARYLDDRAVPAWLLELGGELRSRGRATADRPWRVAIEGPSLEADRPVAVVRLEDAAISTSGVHRQGFFADGRRYGHVLDPRTGAPVRHGAVSVSVVAPTALEADAWATALLVLGPVEGPPFARDLRIAALWIEAFEPGWRLSRTPAFEALMTVGGTT